VVADLCPTKYIVLNYSGWMAISVKQAGYEIMQTIPEIRVPDDYLRNNKCKGMFEEN